MVAPLPGRTDPLVEHLQRALADLTVRVERLEVRRRPLTAADDAALLSAIAANLGASVFGAADLLAVKTGELPSLLDGLDARRVGAWLRRIHQHGGAGRYRLQKIGRDERGMVWAVCHDIHDDTQPRGQRPAQ